MPRDEEMRKVAEDLRALGRSVARDVRIAVDEALRSGHPSIGAFRDSLRGVADETHRAVRQNWRGYTRFGAPAPCAPWMRPRSQRSRPPGPGPAPDGSPWCGPSWGGPSWGRRPPRRPYPPVRRRWDAATIVGLLSVLFGSAWLLGALGALNVPVEGVLAVALMVLGAAVIVTARTDWSLSRHTWPVVLGLVLVAALVATSSGLGVPGALRHASIGSMTRNASAGRTVYGGLGTLTVHAENVQPGQTFTVESDAGQTKITTAYGAPVVVRAQVLAGQICVDGKQVASGVDARVSEGSPGSSAITVDARQLFGEILIDSNNGCRS